MLGSVFLSTPSVWRATVQIGVFGTKGRISIHALRVEGDGAAGGVEPTEAGISIHALRVEGDIGLRAFSKVYPNFYPRPPCGGRPAPLRRGFPTRGISIHALRVEGDFDLAANCCKVDISIHALRVEGDTRQATPPKRRQDFYPRPPRGGRRWHPAQPAAPGYFYPRPPRGGRPARHFFAVSKESFLSTPSAWRATWPGAASPAARTISIHALRVEGDEAGMYRDFHIRQISIHALRVEGDPSQRPNS